MSDSNLPSFDLMQRLQQLLLSAGDVTEFLNDLTQLSTQVIPHHPLACGITMRFDENALTVASSDERAERLDESQYVTGEGPCLQALRTGTRVLCHDLEAEPRWPQYTPLARREGLRCSLSIPLSDGDTTVGALNIYGFDLPDLFGVAEQHLYTLFAAQASGTLRLVTRRDSDTALLAQFEEALGSRSVIDQAMGILIGRHSLDTAQAFDLLRVQSQTTHRKLRDIATDLVTDATGLPPVPGRPFDAGVSS